MVRTGGARNLPKIHTSNYCIAYLDFLGAGEFMSSNRSDEFLNNLNSIYYDAMNSVEFTRVVDEKDIQVKIFSDNILLAIKINKNDELRNQKIERIIDITGSLYNNALYHGYLLRGAIAEGSFYKDDSKTFVYGKALIDAVNMEEKLAIYPRIIVQKEIYETLPQYFEESEDGCFVLNNFLFKTLIMHDVYKHNLIEMYKKYDNNEKVRQKIMWVITNFNNFYKKSAARIQITKEELNNASNETQKDKGEK